MNKTKKNRLKRNLRKARRVKKERPRRFSKAQGPKKQNAVVHGPPPEHVQLKVAQIINAFPGMHYLDIAPDIWINDLIKRGVIHEDDIHQVILDFKGFQREAYDHKGKVIPEKDLKKHYENVKHNRMIFNLV
jgi:hypothetical protein